ncbi:unnamed protein product, partial [Mesorhabditis spiculigera]
MNLDTKQLFRIHFPTEEAEEEEAVHKNEEEVSDDEDEQLSDGSDAEEEGQEGEGEFTRIVVKVELESGRLCETDFTAIVVEALRTVLGTCGPSFQIGHFNEATQKGSVIVATKDRHLVWAALGIYGRTSGNRKIAFHFNQLTYPEREGPLYL